MLCMAVTTVLVPLSKDGTSWQVATVRRVILAAKDQMYALYGYNYHVGPPVERWNILAGGHCKMSHLSGKGPNVCSVWLNYCVVGTKSYTIVLWELIYIDK